MPALALPLLIALLPLAAMAILQFAMPVLAPMVMAEIGRPAADYGWLGGALGLGAVMLLLASHGILPALGPVRTLQAGLVTAMSGVAAVLTGWWPAMLIGCWLVGFGYATTTPAGSQVLADFTPRALWGTMFSLRMAAVPLGGVTAGLLGSLVAPTYGWQVGLALIIAVCALALVVLLVVPRRFNRARPLTPLDLRTLFSPATLLRPARLVASVPGLASLGLASWCMAAVHAVVTMFYVIYLVSARGVPLADAASLFAAFQVAAVCGRIVLGALADRIGSPRPVLKALAPLAGGSALLLAAMDADWSQQALLAATLAIGAVVGAFNGLYLAEVARLAPAGDVGDATASVAVFVFTAYLVMPPATGLAFTRLGATVTLQVVSLFAVVAFALYVWRDSAGSKALAQPRETVAEDQP